jgi:hypothetical protein
MANHNWCWEGECEDHWCVSCAHGKDDYFVCAPVCVECGGHGSHDFAVRGSLPCHWVPEVTIKPIEYE